MNKVIEQIRKGYLYPLLAICTKEDLDPLVEIILSKPMNLLDVDDAYKTHKPDHTHYHKVVGDEIRIFGGNSIRNLFRGEGPPYSEIVADVCQKLDVPYVEGETVKNEANLLDIFIEQRWQSLSPADRQRFAADARKAAADKSSGTASVGGAAAGYVAVRLALGPAGWAFLGISLLDANFKVTIPCVLHIAYLRRRILEEWRGNGPACLPGPEAPASAVRSSALVIAAENGEPVLSLARISEPPGKAAWRTIDPTDNGISRLNPLLAAVPSLASAHGVATTRFMEVVCDGPLAAAKTGGGFRGFSMDSKGIKSHVNLFEPDKLAAMVNVSALMNVASIALAQKHLADFSKKLGEIKEAIDGIRKFQNDERRSKLTGSIRYFEQVAPAVLDGELPSRVLYQIEHHEAELLQVHEHLVEDIHAELKAVRGLKDDEWFGSSEATAAIETHQRRIRELYLELILCIRARSCGWQLLCVFPGEEMSKARRRLDIQMSLEGLATDGKLLRETDDLLRKKIHKLSSFWNSGTTVNERKLALLKANETLLADIVACRAEVLRDLRAADEMFAALRKPVAMAVRIEEGRITAIRAL